jgi:hypothetical protein
MGKEHRKIGDILVAAGLISDLQLTEALDIQKKTGALLGEILVGEGLVSEQAICQALHSGAPGRQPRDRVDERVLGLIREDLARSTTRSRCPGPGPGPHDRAWSRCRTRSAAGRPTTAASTPVSSSSPRAPASGQGHRAITISTRRWARCSDIVSEDEGSSSPTSTNGRARGDRRADQGIVGPPSSAW